MNRKTVKILAIETSCDETSASLFHTTYNIKHVTQVDIKSNIISSQVKLHAKYGGVYPELASREHVKNILPVVQESLEHANSRTKKQKNMFFSSSVSKFFGDINYLAVTTGPGLIGSLLVGVNTAKTLAYVFKKPIYAINHVEGHIYSNFVGAISNNQFPISKPASKPKDQLPSFPALALIVSGGHTSLVYMKNHLDYKVIGETLDDAAGEAFDKVSAMLGLGYPGGPVIAKVADSCKKLQKVTTSYDKLRKVTKGYVATNRNLLQPSATIHNLSATDRNHISFPRPMINSGDFNFSFSGLKTSVLYTLKRLRSANQPLNQSTIQLICKEFQNAVVETLVTKTIRAAKKYKVKSVLLCGGVASNEALREMLHATCYKLHVDFFVPEKSLCTDNAAMIGCAAAYKIALGKKPTPWYNVNADSNLQLDK